jgi:hypothetical protein
MSKYVSVRLFQQYEKITKKKLSLLRFRNFSSSGKKKGFKYQRSAVLKNNYLLVFNHTKKKKNLK